MIRAEYHFSFFLKYVMEINSSLSDFVWPIFYTSSNVTKRVHYKFRIDFLSYSSEIDDTNVTFNEYNYL